MAAPTDVYLYGEKYSAPKHNHYKYFEYFLHQPVLSETSSSNSWPNAHKRRDKYYVDSSSDPESIKDDEEDAFESYPYESFIDNNVPAKDFEVFSKFM